jgi:hypothetical protein
MKKLPILVGMVLGMIVGLFITIPDGFGLKVVMMSIGLVVGAVIGSVFSRQGKNTKTRCGTVGLAGITNLFPPYPPRAFRRPIFAQESGCAAARQ